MGSNPYADACDTPGTPGAPPVPFGVLARAVFLRWERLRLLYLGLLVPFTLLLHAVVGAFTPERLFEAFLGGVLANVCYFAGPVAEVYLRWLGVAGRWPRWLLFGAGTTLTALLCVATLLDRIVPL